MISHKLFKSARFLWHEIRKPLDIIIGKERLEKFLSCLGFYSIWLKKMVYRKRLPDGTTFMLRGIDETLLSHMYEDCPYKDADIKEGGTVVDIGSHIGGYAVYAAKRTGPKGLIICIEPFPENFRLLSLNTRANPCSQYILVNKAVSDHRGKGLFYLHHNPASHSLQKKAQRSIEVGLCTLDDILKEHRLGKIDLLKIDAEGAEMMILKGGEEALNRTERIILEIHPPMVTVKNVIDFLSQRGFHCADMTRQDGEAVILACKEHFAQIEK